MRKRLATMSLRSSWLWWWAATAIVVVCSCEDDELFVQVKNGVMRGKYSATKNGRVIRSYTGIPYARPPIGDLRFKPPVPSNDWSGVLDATKVHALCPQRNTFTRSDIIEGDEDCLFLNVYTHKRKESEAELLPVMFFLHGGGWLCCSGNTMYYGPDVLMDRDVVLVIPNYRLGPLGLLSTGDEVVPGNNALKDQALALKWVHENIEKFGGDKDSVTIFGESAGGASVHLFMMSPLTKGLFKYGISQSGTALCPWAFSPKDQGVRYGKKLAELLDCPTDCTKAMVECLRKVDANKIIAQDVEFMKWDKDPIIPFKPVVEPKHEGAFLDEHPVDLIRAGKVHSVPWILGVNTEDGLLRSAALFGIPSLLDELGENFVKNAAISLQFDESVDNPDAVVDEVRKFYFGDDKIDMSKKDNITNMYTDGWFMSGIDRAIYLHKKYLNQPLYYYLFGYRGLASYSEIFGDPTGEHGVCHADELMYLFPVLDTLFSPKIPDSQHRKVDTLLTTLWSNMAKHGDPTPEINDVVPIKWKRVEDPNEMEYLYIGNDDEVRMKKGLYTERSLFWRSLIAGTDMNDVRRDEL